jgi:ribosomal protein S18 acetylase RimI-like enzyme
VLNLPRPVFESGQPGVSIRRATGADAEGIAAVWQVIAAERIYSAIDQPWTVEEQRAYLFSISPREAIHVATTESSAIIGLQTLDLWAPAITSMRHVAQIGTFLLPEWRRRGVGRALFQTTQAFARNSGYSKFVIQVRASNQSAQVFYCHLGFRECGRFSRQVRIDGHDDDEILMEYFL